jgi:hydrogenase maturation protease
MTELLVIGYGNELRGDDGAGPCVARTVAGWRLAGVRALAVHQLTPELAEELADATSVVFVDAAADAVEVTWRRVHPTDEPARLGHVSDPAWLLGLTRALAGQAPEAWLATIPARVLGHGAGLSPATARDVEAVLTGYFSNWFLPSSNFVWQALQRSIMSS